MWSPKQSRCLTQQSYYTSGILCTQGYCLYTGVCFVHRGMLCTRGYALYTGVSFFFHNLYFLYFVLLMSVGECSKEWMVSVMCVLECHLPVRATGHSLLVRCQLLYCPPRMDSGLRVRNASANGALGGGELSHYYIIYIAHVLLL